MREYLGKGLGLLLWVFIKILLLPAYLGRPGYFFIGLMTFFVLNTLGFFTGILDSGKPNFYWPDSWASLADDGEEIADHLS